MNSLDSTKESELANTEIKNRTAKQVEICYLAEKLLVCSDQTVTDYTWQFKFYECITLCQKFENFQFRYCWQTAGLHSKSVDSFVFFSDKQFDMSYSSMPLVLDFQAGSSVCISHYLTFLLHILLSYIKESQVFF